MERNEQIEALYPLALKIAKSIVYRYPKINADDIVSDAGLGLIKGVDSFDPSYGTLITTHVRYKIYGEIFNGMRARDPLSERARRKIRQAENRRYEIADEIGHFPSMVEMEQEIPGLDKARQQQGRLSTLSIGEFNAEQVLIADFASDPQLVFDRHETHVEIGKAVQMLSERQRHVLDLHYEEEATMRYIGNELGVSSQRASQLHLIALDKLRQQLEPVLTA